MADQPKIYQEIPPKVEYSLTEPAESFVPILAQMKEWSKAHLGGTESAALPQHDRKN